MTVTDISSRSTEQAPFTPRRAMHSPPRKRATAVSIAMGGTDESPLKVTTRINESTEIETVRLRNVGATTVIFRDQMTGTAVEVTLDDADMLRLFNLVGAVNEHQAAG